MGQCISNSGSPSLEKQNSFEDPEGRRFTIPRKGCRKEKKSEKKKSSNFLFSDGLLGSF